MTPPPAAAALAAALHDLGPYEQDGGVPDVCNRWPEHEAAADTLLAALAASGWQVTRDEEGP